MKKSNRKQNTFSAAARSLAQELIAFAQSQSKDISDVKITISSNSKFTAEVERGKVSRAVTGGVETISVKLFSGDKSISFKRNTTNLKDLKKAISQNIEALPYVPGNADKRLLPSSRIAPPSVQNLDLYDESPFNDDQLVTYARAVEAAARDHEKVKDLRAASVTRNENHVLILATNGIDIERKKTLYSTGVGVIVESNGKMENGGEYYSARHFSDMPDPETIGKKAVANALAKLGAILPETGEYPIILDHHAAQEFFKTVMDSINGSTVYKGQSIFKNALGKEIINPDITIEDDPLVKRGLGSQEVDNAGIEAKKISFIENGVLKAFNVNAFSARKLKCAPIGRENGLTNTRVLPGKKSPEELMQNVKDGIFIKGFLGGTVDINSGVFSRQAYGALIENGKITDRAVSGFVVACRDLREIFKKVTIADDTPDQPKSNYRFAAPTTRIDGMTISGR